MANSRVRWAIVIESVLAITKAPTKSAMPPNASRKFCRMLVNAGRVLRRLLGLLPAPVRTCAAGGRSGRISASSCAAWTPGFAATSIESSLPALPNSFCAVGEVEDRDRRAAERRDAAELDDAGDP